MFTFVLLSIIKDSLNDIENRNDWGENSSHTEKGKHLQFLWHCLLCLL